MSKIHSCNCRSILKIIVYLLAFVAIILYLRRSKRIRLAEMADQVSKEEILEKEIRGNETENKIAEKAAPKDLRNLIKCSDKDFSTEFIQHGDYWLLKNYAKASTYFKCDESITYTTHSDFTFLENTVPLLERWQAPLSIAMWAPGDIFDETINAILKLRNCHEQSSLVLQFATFHIYFEARYLPQNVPRDFDEFEQNIDCQDVNKLSNFSMSNSIKTRDNLTYPINIGRNLARESALTHFVLASDIELYPNPGLVEDFLTMKLPEEFSTERNVFSLPVFEVGISQAIPEDKLTLINMVQEREANWFHFKFCPKCHQVPQAEEWILSTAGTNMEIFATAKRRGIFFKWEPIYIGTNAEPSYDERLNWEGKKDKMTQAYVMCLLDYNFHVLSNGFLTHKPGIKSVQEAHRYAEEQINEDLITKKILPEISVFYGTRDGCVVH